MINFNISSSHQRRLFLSVAALLLVSLSVFVQTARGQVPESQVPQDLRAGIAAEVEWRGYQYAGLCREINQAEYLGQSCAFVQSLTPSRAEVTFGAVLSDELHEVVFPKTDGVWVATGRGPVPSNQVPAELRAAIRTEVESRGKVFAGLCLEISQSQHVGEWCASVQSLTESAAEVTMGGVLSDEVETVTFRKSGSTWVTGAATSSPSPTATATVAPSPSIPPELKGAIKAAVEARGQTYAGLCTEIQPHEHVGKWCAGVNSLTATEAKVFVGAVLADELHAITFVNSGNRWAPKGTIAPPNTGNAGLAAR